VIEPDDVSGPDPKDPGMASARALARVAGRYVVTFADDVNEAERRDTLRSAAGVTSVLSTRDTGARLDAGQLADAEAVVFSRVGVATVSAGTAEAAALRASGRVLSVRPARVYRVLAQPGTDVLNYLLGRRDELADLCAKLGPGLSSAPIAAVEESYQDTSQLTWGLTATRVPASPYTGRGVRVAVLDTGFTLGHPDFAGRPVLARSFVALADPPGGLQGPDDGHGHGTHCTGTACGPAAPPTTRRYGVAPDADILIAKVLGDDGFGDDDSIIAGIEWALANDCHILSMSLGARVQQVDPARPRRRLPDHRRGGEQRQPGLRQPRFVEVPANSPSIMAVGAVDRRLGIADFSARSLAVDGGQVDIAGPGVAVFSSWRVPPGYNTIQRHQHGHPARGGHRRAVVRGDRSPGPGALVDAAAGSPPAEPVVRRRRGRARSGAEHLRAAMVDRRMTVTVDDQHLASIDEVAAELRRLGMSVHRVHRRTGIIIGSAPAERRTALGGVAGVASIADGRDLGIAPPESGTQ